ncbi:MAG: alpha/beta fold hydrolase [Gammaproteobacteria bacterium]|nr:alpha/beta fold hydrolase [Gammaproteobacteria bacterium]
MSGEHSCRRTCRDAARTARILAPVAALALPFVAAALDIGADRRLDNGAHLHWTPCWFETPPGESAHCGWFQPSDGSTGARRVRLPVVVLKYGLADARESPVLYLPAGPGYPAGLDAAGMRGWWLQRERLRWPHDLVLYDPRGAGLAEPGLHCPEILEADRAGLAEPLSAAQDLRRLRAAARACRARLLSQGVDPARFSAAAQVRDAGELMALLGGNDWNLWGVSYGTRLALHVLREYPERVRAAILDSTYPPEVNGLLAKPEQFARTLDGLAARCARDAACGAAYPQLGRRMAQLLSRLAARPLLLEVEKWPGLWRQRLAVNDYRLLWMLFEESYARFYRPRYPRAVAAALRGDPEPLLPLAESFIGNLLDPAFSHGLYYATLCAEDLAGVDRAAYLAQVRRFPSVAAQVADDWDLHACHAWRSPELPSRYRMAVASEVPVLFLNGEHDTVTFPEWAARAARRFRNGRHVVFVGSAHAVTWENDCAMAAAWEFLAAPGNWVRPSCLAGASAAMP